jgi:hypothetical protein
MGFTCKSADQFSVDDASARIDEFSTPLPEETKTFRI